MSTADGPSVAIMQPAFLPWLGYFDLIDQVDTFVFLDSVQFAKRSWQQRNRLRGPGGPVWLTVPVQTKALGRQRIAEVCTVRHGPFPDGHIARVRHLYARTPFFSDYFEVVAGILAKGHEKIADLNIELIGWLCDCLGLMAPTLRSSSLPAVGAREVLLENICRHLGAKLYLSPEGSRVYLDESDAFTRPDVELAYQVFEHPRYRQIGEGFVSHLSVLDLLFNEGPESLGIIRSGRRAVAARAE